VLSLCSLFFERPLFQSFARFFVIFFFFFFFFFFLVLLFRLILVGKVSFRNMAEKGQAFFNQHVLKYGKAPIFSEYIDSLVGPKAISAKKKSFAKVYIVVTAHRFFAMSVSKILKKPEVLLDAPLFDLRMLQNNQPNRVYLQFDGKVRRRTRKKKKKKKVSSSKKEREIELSTLQDAAFVLMLRTALAKITTGLEMEECNYFFFLTRRRFFNHASSSFGSGKQRCCSSS
jgi:hypothetical protein